MEMIVTRIGLNSKMIICGDVSQVDLKHKSDSGFKFMCECADRVPNMVAIELTTNHRNEIVEYLIKEYADKYERENAKKPKKKKTVLVETVEEEWNTSSFCVTNYLYRKYKLWNRKRL